ncbi:5-oxoprolinase subunit PxpB [Aliikangiella maris]|uniref:5-oxoprolinase subunit PxpB n=2 Tax=Aliikangiella maris TaxID=3162458 RepID=A0ABV3MJ58_9GAMM
MNQSDELKQYEWRNNGDSAVTLCFKQAISEPLSIFINTLKTQLQKQFSVNAVNNIIPAYQSLTVCFNPLVITRDKLMQQINPMIEQLMVLPPDSPAQKSISIPVCYEALFAPDLEFVCQHTGLSPAEIIKCHTAPKYLVHMLGFSPGFLYLGGLDKALYCPRKSVPAKQVAPGSVGIGGQQTGLYPQATPGGWQIIGRTPLSLFDAQWPFPAIAHPLDTIQFTPINSETFYALSNKD